MYLKQTIKAESFRLNVQRETTQQKKAEFASLEDECFV